MPTPVPKEPEFETASPQMTLPVAPRGHNPPQQIANAATSGGATQPTTGQGYPLGRN